MNAIDILLRRIERDPAGATAAVKEFVAAYGSPIVEGRTATFLFFDGRPADAVYLLHWVFGLESRQAFVRIPKTQAWFLTIDLPLSSRVEYKFEVHRNGRSDWIKDPRNKHLAFDPFGANSVCRMTGYADPEWVLPEADARPGTLERFGLKSEVFGEEREIKVYLPYEYKPTKRYPLLVCHDGDDYLRYAGLQTVLDNLIARHEVRPLVVAMTRGGQRNEEYAANPLQARFLVDEVVPAMRRRHRLYEDPRDTGLMGASFGAVSSLYTAWSRPGVFGQLMLQSGSFVFTDVGRHDRGPLWDPVVDFTNAFRHQPENVQARLYLSCGVFERLIYYNRSLVPLLRSAGVEHRFVESFDGHNWVGWRDHLRSGLSWLFPGHLWMIYD